MIEGDHSLFLRYDEVSWAWQVVDPILKVWATERDFIHTYPAGSWGPREADRLFEREDQRWRNTMEEARSLTYPCDLEPEFMPTADGNCPPGRRLTEHYRAMRRPAHARPVRRRPAAIRAIFAALRRSAARLFQEPHHRRDPASC